jgi:hypothetical protein
MMIICFASARTRCNSSTRLNQGSVNASPTRRKSSCIWDSIKPVVRWYRNGLSALVSISVLEPVGLENSMQCLTCGCGLPCSGEGVEDRVGGLS